MILYFSGTGNSRWVARQLADGLNDEMLSIAELYLESRKLVLGKDEPLGFVFPVYSWGPPQIVLKVLEALSFDVVPSYLYFVCTCGDDVGKTAAIFRRAVKKKGWRCKAGFSVIMPNTYVCLPSFDVDFKSVEEKKLEESNGRMEVVLGAVMHRLKGFDCHEGGLPILKSYFIRPLFNAFLSSPKKFHVTDDCIRCGLCEQVCPVHNIKMNEKPEWGSDCTMCLSCYHHCPKHAIAYGSQTQNKGQYLHK
ncbi:EFR1 family ferrodoxin [uncultured Bacteroides sp.]|uniref:EFR1 family ferrodoxin n=1 Tax=uncultured Bacteroides sp. TaxID=162156 RepID=UPI00260A5CB0|nr:EFR1 family ferrodoxin [uncultured Bacteroides sp.]